MLNKNKFSKRLFEVLPGLIAWTTITSPIWGGIFFPEIIAYFVLVFNAFWVYKSLSSILFFVIGYIKIRDSENMCWLCKLKRLLDIQSGIRDLKVEIVRLNRMRYQVEKFNNKYYQKTPKIIKKVIFELSKRKTKVYLEKEMRNLEKYSKIEILDWRNIRHIVIIPFWKEPYEVLKRSLDKLADQTFPKDRINIVLGAEERYPPARDLALKLQKEYKDKFENVWVNNHKLVEGEIVGKSSNMASCGRNVQKMIEKLGWEKSEIIVTSCDCDTQFDKQYFAYLTYLFVTDPDRYTHFYAAPMVFYANFWKVPFYSRLVNTLFTINNISTAARPDKFIQVSSYSFSWNLLEDIDFWVVDIIPEDFHMFFKALFIYGEKVATIPIYLKNLSDAAEGIGHRSTIKNQYEQVKRWAWGTSDHPWMIKNWFKSKKSFYVTYRVFHTIFDHITWSIISFILMFGANLPPLINKEFSMTVFGQKLPKVSSFMMTITSIIFVFTIILDLFLKPKRNQKVSIFRFVFEQLQWIVFPYVSIIFGALPGLDAQTRLLFGKYMEYRLTEKH